MRSRLVSSFLLRAYPTMKKYNPHTPIMIREALGVEPKVYARYGTSINERVGSRLTSGNPEFAKEKMEALNGMSQASAYCLCSDWS